MNETNGNQCARLVIGSNRFGYHSDGSLAWEARLTRLTEWTPELDDSWVPNPLAQNVARWQSYLYDSAGRLAQRLHVALHYFSSLFGARQSLGEDLVEHFRYGDEAQSLYYLDAAGVETVAVWDDLGRITSVQVAGETLLSRDLSSASLVTETIPCANASGELRRELSQNAFDQVVRSAVGLRLQQLRYNGLGQVVEPSSPEGNQRFDYNNRGDLVRVSRVSDWDTSIALEYN